MAKKDDSTAPPEARQPEPALVPRKPSEEPERKAPSDWAAAKGTKAWALAGARQRFDWPAGLLLTEADFDKAIHEVANLQFSSPSVLVRRPQKAPKRGKRWLSRA